MLVRNPRVPNITITLDNLNLYFTGNLHYAMFQKKMRTAMRQQLRLRIFIGALPLGTGKVQMAACKEGGWRRGGRIDTHQLPVGDLGEHVMRTHLS